MPENEFESVKLTFILFVPEVTVIEAGIITLTRFLLDPEELFFPFITNDALAQGKVALVPTFLAVPEAFTHAILVLIVPPLFPGVLRPNPIATVCEIEFITAAKTKFGVKNSRKRHNLKKLASLLISKNLPSLVTNFSNLQLKLLN
jgi:hypothetical protein